MQDHQKNSIEQEAYVTFTGIRDITPDHACIQQYGICDFDADTAQFLIEASYLHDFYQVRDHEDLTWYLDAIKGKITITPPNSAYSNENYGCKFLVIGLRQFICDVEEIQELISKDQKIREFWKCSHELFPEETANPAISGAVLKLTDIFGIDLPPVILIYDTFGILNAAYLSDIFRILKAWTSEGNTPIAISMECLDCPEDADPGKRRKQYRNLIRACRNFGLTPSQVTCMDGTTHKCVLSSNSIQEYLDYWELEQMIGGSDFQPVMPLDDIEDDSHA